MINLRVRILFEARDTFRWRMALFPEPNDTPDALLEICGRETPSPSSNSTFNEWLSAAQTTHDGLLCVVSVLCRFCGPFFMNNSHKHCITTDIKISKRTNTSESTIVEGMKLLEILICLSCTELNKLCCC